MKKVIIKAIGIMLVFSCMLSLLTGCNESEKASYAKTLSFSKLKYTTNTINDGEICQNDRFIMSWNDTYKQVVFTDKQSESVYSTMPTEAMQVEYDEEGYEIKNNVQIESPIIVYYYNPSTISENIAYGSLDSIESGDIFSEVIDNGIKVTYVFPSQEIAVSVVYKLNKDNFEISVDPKEIYDNGESIVTGVAIAPFLCSLKNDSQDSYLFMPDGSGAIVKPQDIDKVGRQGSTRVYGEDVTINDFTLSSYTEKINMPIFGKKQGDTAILGIITSSAERTYLNWDIGSSAKKYSSIYPFFRIRGYDVVKRPSGFVMSLAEIPLFDDYITEEVMKVNYYPLSGEDANYTGMAKTYRENLLKNGQLNKSNQGQAATIRILGGLNQKTFNFGVPATKLAKLTTISEAEEIVKYFDKKVDGDIIVSLVGFGESGLDVGKIGSGFKISSKLGKKSAIASLTDFCKDSNIKLFMDFDIVGFNKSGNGFTTSNDTAKSFDGQTKYLSFYNNITRISEGKTSYMLLSRDRLGAAAEKAVKTTQKYGFNGVSLSSLSTIAYSDYSSVGAGVSGGLSKTVIDILKNSAKKTEVITSNANIYAAGYSDYITETPVTSSQFDITAYDVPFYQMVLRGYAPMSSASINISVDYETAVLKCIESGISPSFTLTYNYDNSFASSKFSAIPVSYYNGQKEKIVETVNKVNDVLENTSNATISQHLVLENGLRVTKFDNGATVIVNYSDETVDYEGASVGAKDYIVWEE
ncbi:MAG: hypothetical protein IKY45_03510 [Clostridia bacterium]|nr:hypothetical protein [Clostridia bacterium]